MIFIITDYYKLNPIYAVVNGGEVVIWGWGAIIVALVPLPALRATLPREGTFELCGRSFGE